MVAGALGICGTWTGSTVPAGPENPKGYFEHITIRQQVTKQILIRLGCDPSGVRKLPPIDFHAELPWLPDIIREIIETDGYLHDMPWLYKDPKLALLWPIYRKAFPDATWLVVNRDTEESIDSCLRTYFMKAHTQNRDFWKAFAEEYLKRIDALKASGARVLEISSPDIINGNLESLEKLAPMLNLTYREKELRAFISPDYWHGNSSNRP